MENEKEKINITVTGEKQMLTILHGEANPAPVYKKIGIVGNVFAPARFIEHALASVTAPGNGIIIINIPDKSIRLETMLGTNDEGVTVTGRLTLNPALFVFGINTDKQFGNKELQNLIRKNAHVFENIETAKSLIKTLQNFSVTFEQLKEEADDRAGNKESKWAEKIKISKGQLPDVFKILTPVYKDTPEIEFDLEIELDRVGKEVVYSFYCVGFEDRVDTHTKKLLEDNVSVLCRIIYPVITVS